MDAFSALMRRYAFAYTAAHDFARLPELMVEDYLLRMGEHHVRGRDGAYRAATQRQYDQFPGLGFTVHHLVSNGDRLALVFTEHGASRRRGGRLAAWRGISLYRWDGARLVECIVEQDYQSRRRQLDCGTPDPVDPPAHDPWTAPPAPADGSALDRVTAWLRGGGLARAKPGRLDDEIVGAAPARAVLTGAACHVLDAFSAGPQVAFAARIQGTYAGGLPGLDARRGTAATLYCTGIAAAGPDGVRLRQAITDRLGLSRRLTSGAAAAADLTAVPAGEGREPFPGVLPE